MEGFVLCYTPCLYNESIDKYETLDRTVSPKIALNNFQGTNTVSVSEATVPRCSTKQVFLNISQNSQENTGAGVSIISY